jgi:formate hydrogenlyase subunit 6/NADH:ubiquinone oxidoreductase subunit I
MKIKLGSFIPELIRHFFKRPVTIDYPFEKITMVKGFRGTPILSPERCIGCKACERDCPASAIEIIQISPPEEKEKKLQMTIHNDRCVHCAQCAESCPTKALAMDSEYELAAGSRKELKAVYQYVRASLSNIPKEPSTPPRTP